MASQEQQSGPEFRDKEEIAVVSRSREGDYFKSVCQTVREENGSTVEYISIKEKGLKSMNSPDGETVTVQDVEESSLIGKVEYLPELVGSLEALYEKVGSETVEQALDSSDD
jgi:hypothetical protein